MKDRRENRLLTAYCATTVFATGLWWLGLVLVPGVRASTLGQGVSVDGFWLFLAADVVFAGILPMVVLIARRFAPSFVSTLLWIHFGGQAYAFLVSVGCTFVDPAAYWGVVSMMVSAGAGLAFAMRASEIPILWGPFAFRPAVQLSAQALWRSTLRQTAVMWLIFLVLVPGVIVLVENISGCRQSSRITVVTGALLVAAILGAGGIGIRSAWCMIRDGEGTPLPASCAKRLVESGPYRYVRNPMALFGVVQVVCVGVLVESPLVIVYGFLGALWWEILVRPLEEGYLEGVFGAQYTEYRQRVWCWIPRPRPDATRD